MIRLNKEQINNFTLEVAEKRLKKLSKLYNLDKSFQKNPEHFQAVWSTIDDIVDEILYLEDRIRALKFVDAVALGKANVETLDKVQ